MSVTEIKPAAPEGDKPSDDSAGTTVAVVEKTTAELAGQTYDDGSRVEDPKALETALTSFVTEFGEFWKASQKVAMLRAQLAVLIMTVRRSIILGNGQKDYFGASDAYRTIYNDRIIGLLKDEYQMPSAEAKALLNSVRVNYVNANEMVKRAIIDDMLSAPDAKPELKAKYGERLQAVAGKDGAGQPAPITETTEVRTVSDGSGLPAPIRKAVEKVYADRYRKADGTLPAQAFPYREKGTGGRTEDGPPDPKDALAQINEGLSVLVQIAPSVVVPELHRIASEVSDYLIGEPGKKGTASFSGGQKKVAEQVETIASLLHATAAHLAGAGKKDGAAPFRFTETTEDQ